MKKIHTYMRSAAPVALCTLVLLLLVSVLSPVPGRSLAASSGEYGLFWWTVDGGGGPSRGDAYTLSETAGQAEAGAPMRAGNYSVSGGFWGGGGAGDHSVYLPLVVRFSP